MEDYEKIMELCEELKEYAEIEGSELGEVCQLLISIANYISYVDTDFYAALFKEINGQLDNFKKKCRIVEQSRTEIYKYKELEWDC